MTNQTPSPRYHIIVLCEVLDDGSGAALQPTALSQVLSDAFLARKGVWRFDYIPTNGEQPPSIVPLPLPPVPPAPNPIPTPAPTPTGNKWTVAYGPASLHITCDANAAISGYAQVGDTLYGSEIVNGWLNSNRGWVRLTQVKQVLA